MVCQVSGIHTISIFCNLLSIHTNSNFKAYRREDKMYKDTHTEKITTIHDITQRKESGNVLGNAYNPISRSTISKTHFSITTTILHLKKKKKKDTKFRSVAQVND